MKNAVNKLIEAENKMMQDYAAAFITPEALELMDANMLASYKSAIGLLKAYNEVMLKQAEMMDAMMEKLNALEVKN